MGKEWTRQATTVRLWTDYEDGLLRLLWPTVVPTKLIAKVLRRSEASVTWRAHKGLGLGMKAHAQLAAAYILIREVESGAGGGKQ